MRLPFLNREKEIVRLKRMLKSHEAALGVVYGRRRCGKSTLLHIMSGLLAPERRETFIGYAKILEVFQITKVGKVAGCQVTEGIVERGAGVRLLRDDVVIHEGKLKTLKRFKDEVKDVQTGQECGMAFENYEDIRQGDVIECFRVETVQRSL